MRKLAIGLTSLLLLFAAGWAQSNADVALHSGPAQNNLIIGTTQEPSNLNPWEGAADTKENIMALLNTGLTYFDSEGALQPGLATEVPTEENGRLRLERDADGNVTSQEVEWTIRDDAVWSDGAPITCADAEFTFAVQSNPNLPVTTRAFSGLVDDVACTDGPDGKTFVVDYNEANLFFANIGGSIGLARFNDLAPRHIWEPIIGEGGQDVGDPEADFLGVAPATGSDPSQVVGSGAFRLVEWQINQFMRLERRDDFVLSPPGDPANYVQEITVRFITNQATLISAILSGEIDATDDIGLAGQDPQILANQLGDTATVDVTPSGFIEKLNFNLFNDPNGIGGLFPDQVDCQVSDDLLLWDVRTRQAVIQAIDREELGATVFPGAIVSNSFIIRGDPGFNEELNPWAYSPDGARDLLAEIGWTDEDGNGVLERTTEDGRTVEFELPWVSTTAGFRVRTGEILQEFLADVGIALEVQNLPASVVFSSEFLNHGAECTWGGIVEYAEAGGIGQAPADPLSNELWARSDLGQAEPANIPVALNGFSGTNIFGWYNPEFDQMRLDALNEFDPASRAEIVAQMQTIYNEQLPTVPLYERAEVVTKKIGLVNFNKGTATARTQFWNAWEWGWEQNGAESIRD